jgi:hypothetical protein
VVSHDGIDEANTHDDSALLQLSAVHSDAAQTSEDLAQCRLLMPIFEKNFKSVGKLEGLCRKAFPKATCQKARRALSEKRPWTGKAIGAACAQLESAGSWQSRVKLEPLLLRRSGKELLSLAQGSARARLDASLKFKEEEQDEVPEPPYSQQDPGVPTVTYYGEPAQPLTQNSETYVEGLGTKVNADWEDTHKWCGQNAAGDLIIGDDCPPQVVANQTEPGENEGYDNDGQTEDQVTSSDDDDSDLVSEGSTAEETTETSADTDATALDETTETSATEQSSATDSAS